MSLGSVIAILVLAFAGSVLIGIDHLIGRDEAILFAALAAARLT